MHSISCFAILIEKHFWSFLPIAINYQDLN